MKFTLLMIAALFVAGSSQNTKSTLPTVTSADHNSSGNNVVFTNGGCTYVNGMIYWNKTSRPANDNDLKMIDDYQAAYADYQSKFQDNLSNFLSNIFGGMFGNNDNNLQVPNPPSAPCFCSKVSKNICSNN